MKLQMSAVYSYHQSFTELCWFTFTEVYSCLPGFGKGKRIRKSTTWLIYSSFNLCRSFTKLALFKPSSRVQNFNLANGRTSTCDYVVVYVLFFLFFISSKKVNASI